MAEAKKDVAATVKDPTITSEAGDAFPEGTHPARKSSEVTHAAENNEYKDMADDAKPDPSSVVQEQVLSGDEATGS